MVHIMKAGIHYKKSSVKVRERIVFPPHVIEEAIHTLNQFEYVNETVILSTCNRTEIYISTADEKAGMEAIKQFISEWFEMDTSVFTPFLNYSMDNETILHLFRMATGLNSMVIGETQILGQLRDAFMQAQQSGATSKLFNELFKRVITFAKRAHEETAIGEQAVSVSYVAVELAKKIFGDIKNQHVFILGAGETGELTLQNLHGANVSDITVVNRTYERAAELAKKYNANAASFDELESTLHTADIVISSTASSDTILTKEMIKPFLKNRKGAPLFLIDIAVPRDMDPDIGKLDNVFLYNMDDLEMVVEENMTARKKTAALIEEQLVPELTSFNNWMSTLGAAPVIKALQEKSNSIQQRTLDSIQRKMPDLTEREMKVLQKHTKSIVNQLLKEPIKQAKMMGASEKDLRHFETIFGLENDS